jgi:hypothetical protein
LVSGRPSRASKQVLKIRTVRRSACVVVVAVFVGFVEQSLSEQFVVGEIGVESPHREIGESRERGIAGGRVRLR